jgi:hypothetical protein
VRGRLSDELAGEIKGFWARHGALTGEAAERRLPEVIAVLRDAGGAVVGVNSAEETSLAHIGDLPFFVYRWFVAAEASTADLARFLSVAFDALDAELSAAGGGPIGLCVLARPDGAITAEPLAPRWPETGLVYAGYTTDGRQVRLRHFAHATLHFSLEHWPLDAGYRIEPFDASELDEDDILAFWRRERAIPDEEAQRRVAEVLQVARHDSGEIAGVQTAFIQRIDLVGMDLWYTRGFVAESHRLSNVAAHFGFQGFDLLERRFVTGQDRRAQGIGFDMQHPGLRASHPEAELTVVNASLVGFTKPDCPLYVRYFPGVSVPLPPRS